jgi:hypothetical protein
MTTGIYKLTFNGTEKVYIGQSRDCIYNRFRQHLATLSRRDGSPKLQEAYNRFGPPLLTILEECSGTIINDREIFYIAKFNSFHNGLNAALGGAIPGEGVNNPNSRYSKISLLKTFRLLRNPTLSYKQISDVTEVSEAVVGRIARGTLHNWMHTKYPNLSKIITANLDKRHEYKCLPSLEGSGYIVKSPEGVLHTIYIVIDFCKKHNLTKGNLMPVLRGRRKSHRGWTLHKAVEK